MVYVADLQKVHFEWPMIRSILRIGIPSGVENSLFNIGKLIVQGFLAGLGTAAIAANAISGSIANFLLVPGGALSLGLITVVGQCIGAGEYDQARYYVRRLMLFVYACNIVLNATLLLILRPLVGLFALSDAAKAIVFQLLPVYAAFQVTLAARLPVSQRFARRGRHPLYDDRFDDLHVDAPSRSLLCVCQSAAPRRPRHLVRHVLRLGRTERLFPAPLPQRKMARKTRDPMTLEQASILQEVSLCNIVSALISAARPSRSALSIQYFKSPHTRVQKPIRTQEAPPL